jgi:hypothetical protein
MAIRITTKTDGDKTTVLVEGGLGAAEAPDLIKECQSVDAPLRLDLSGLKSAAGAELYGASAFISKLLEGSSK